MQVGDLEFGFNIHLVFNVGPDFVFFRLPVLADQDKTRQENGLKETIIVSKPNGKDRRPYRRG